MLALHGLGRYVVAHRPIAMRFILSRPGRKRSPTAERYPSGEVRHKEEVSPIVAKRMMLAAAAKMIDEQWATVLGRYFLTGQINQSQYEAGKRFGILVESYDRVMLGPKPPSQSIGERVKSAEIDPFSEAGLHEAERHKAVLDAVEKARNAIGSRKLFEETRDLCKGAGQIPASYERFMAIRSGLGTLAVFWHIDGTKKRK